MAALGRWDLSVCLDGSGVRTKNMSLSLFCSFFSLRSEVLIGKTAEDNDRLSLQYGKPDEALSTRTAAYRDLHMRVLIVLMDGWTE